MVYDHSYSIDALKGILRKPDFLPVRGKPVPIVDAYRVDLLTRASASAASCFGVSNPIEVFHLKKKPTYRIKGLAEDLVVRKLSKNLKVAARLTNRGRDFVVENLRLHLEEGVPYRLYRIDVKSFYESFTQDWLIQQVALLPAVGPLCKKNLEVLLNFYAARGGSGIPRGMAISAVLSDLMMADFDSKIAKVPAVYFFARFVDDIVILTNGTETRQELIGFIERTLPTGLKLNASKQKVTELVPRVKSVNTLTEPVCTVEYLGYQFVVRDPVSGAEKNNIFRPVKVEIADKKLSKIKSRIVRAFRSFAANPDFDLLRDRVTFLTSNFRIFDKRNGRQRSAGIYYSYPQITEDATSLAELDAYLRHAIFTKKDRAFIGVSTLLDGKMKRILLRHSFSTGHQEKSYVYFSTSRISDIQKCWKYE